ncbi:MAG: GNAT family N-acetyltransferase [Anaerolineales bacterium]|nr:GNAT family N-acetyltransferase [Anaerolineales bacterium]
MTIKDNAYSNSDAEYQEICDFLNTLSEQDPHMLWGAGRMNFWRYSLHANKDPKDPFFQANGHLWRAENGQIVGLCISEYGKDDLFIEILPEFHEIYPAVLDWIDNTWAATHDAVEIDLFSTDSVKISHLTEAGFAFNCHFENERDYDLDLAELDYQLEEGFTVQAFSESADYAGRVALVKSAFDNPGYTEEKLRGLMASPDYIDEYNLVVLSPDNRPVAYCVGWHEPAKEGYGYIEPVGTHAEFRRRGLAKAVIRECFARMKANGIKIVEIASRAEPAVANYLYDALAPQARREVHKYKKTWR